MNEKMNDTVLKIERIYSRLCDEESKNLFNIRLKYSLDRSTSDLFAALGEMYGDWNPYQLRGKLAEYPTEDFVVFGSGYVGKITRNLLNCWGYSNVNFCDIQNVGEVLDGAQVLSVEDALIKHGNALFIIASQNYRKEMQETLLEHGVSPHQILLPHHKYLLALRGTQYFDLFEPMSDEVYVDAGVYDGKSILDFCKWAGGQYRKIYGFEPDKEMCNTANEALRNHGVERVKLFNSATWNTKEDLHFKVYDSHKAGSRITDSLQDVVTVQGLDIDSAVNGDRVTFIKMDIEGSELRGLQGARQTIMNYHPRLAICIYHKPEDIVELGNYILELYPDYKFYIRAYASNAWETVLYAIP